MVGEWSHYYRQAALHDLEVLHARFIEHRFARHSHEFYVIGVVEAGVQAFSYRGARHVTPAGQVFIVNPGEPHTGEAATQGGYVYRTVYPRPALMQQVAADVTVRAALPFFTRAVIHDESLSERLVRFHRVIAVWRPESLHASVQAPAWDDAWAGGAQRRNGWLMDHCKLVWINRFSRSVRRSPGARRGAVARHAEVASRALTPPASTQPVHSRRRACADIPSKSE
jgi:hypothetical protein